MESDSTLVLYSEGMMPAGNKMFVRFANTIHGDLVIRIYDAEGIAVREFIDSGVQPGFHQSLLSLTDLDSGRYTLALIMGSQRKTAVFNKSDG